jgi:hypothetical protein
LALRAALSAEHLLDDGMPRGSWSLEGLFPRPLDTRV